MSRNVCLVAASLALFLHNTAGATHFVVNSTGPHDSVGPWFTAGNALVFPSYPGPLYLSDKITISGTLTQVHPESYASDSTWWLKASTGSGTAFSFIPQITFTTNYTSLFLTDDTFGGFWINNYPQYRFEAVEMGVGNGDQPGVDAQWTNMTFEFHPFVPVISTGSTTGVTTVFDTNGSSFSTQLGLYSLDGELLDHSVDAPGTHSTIDATSLSPGDYYLIVASSDGDFQDLAAMPGAVGGDLKLNYNGASLFDGALDAERVKIISLHVVPEPATLTLSIAAAALGLTAVARRRGARRSMSR